MKTHIENYIYNDSNFGEINAIAGICTSALDEDDLRARIANDTADWRIEGVCWGFGHNHFWLEEEHGSEGYKRVLFVDFTDQRAVTKIFQINYKRFNTKKMKMEYPHIFVQATHSAEAFDAPELKPIQSDPDYRGITKVFEVKNR